MTERFSNSVSRLIDWQAIADSSIGTASRASVTNKNPESQDKSLDLADISLVFGTVRTEFDKALRGLRRLTSLFFILTGVAVAAAIGGVVVAGAFHQAVGGTGLSIGGALALFDLFRRVTRLGREQAMLELIPAKYELALSIAETTADRRLLLSTLLKRWIRYSRAEHRRGND